MISAKAEFEFSTTILNFWPSRWFCLTNIYSIYKPTKQFNTQEITLAI